MIWPGHLVYFCLSLITSFLKIVFFTMLADVELKIQVYELSIKFNEVWIQLTELLLFL